MQKKMFLLASTLLLTLILTMNLVLAINVEVSSTPISDTVITDLDVPAVFDLTIRNLGETDNFEIYSLVGIDMAPNKSFMIEQGEEETIRISVIPQIVKQKTQSYPFEYRIRNSKNEIQKESMIIKIIKLEDAVEVNLEYINPKSEEITLLFKNKVNHDFENIKINTISAFFDYEGILSLKALETKEIAIAINKEEIKSLNAGQYLANIEIKLDSVVAKKEFMINFLEQEDIETTNTKAGLIKITQEISKKNIGNIEKTVKITAKRNLLSYLFTTVNILPSESEINGFSKYYTWEKELIPNEEMIIIINTNWFYPILIIILIIILIVLVRRSLETDLSLRKKVSFVKTKGGQFALKVTLRAKTKRFIERINIIDKLPPLVKLYNRFGAIAPDKIDVDNRRVEWNVTSLNKGEERIFTYIIYSKIGVVGKFELPSARATYEKDGKIKHSTSNRSFFINEPRQG